MLLSLLDLLLELLLLLLLFKSWNSLVLLFLLSSVADALSAGPRSFLRLLKRSVVVNVGDCSRTISSRLLLR